MIRQVLIALCVFTSVKALPARVPGDPTLTERARVANERVEAAQAETRSALAKRLRHLDQRLARLRASVVRARDEGRALPRTLLEEMMLMEGLAANARAEYRDLRVSSQESFDRFRARLEADLQDLESSLNRHTAE